MSKLVQTAKDWYLIQRYDIKQTGLGPDLVRDYMGAAEFENGTVSRAWELLRKMKTEGNLAKHSFQNEITSLDGRALIVIGHKDEDFTEIGRLFKDLREDKIKVKENPYLFKHFVEGSRFKELGALAWLTLPKYFWDQSKAATESFRPVFMTIDKGMANHLMEKL